MDVLLDWIRSDDGARPDLPADCGFAHLVSPGRQALFGLFDVDDEGLEPEQREWLLARAVPHELGALLRECRGYPPALAIAARRFERSAPLTRERFTAELTDLLRELLDRRQEAPFVLARSRVDEVGYREVGECVWIIGFRPEVAPRGAQVAWVSSDYQIYWDELTSFDVNEGMLISAFVMEEKDGTS